MMCVNCSEKLHTQTDILDKSLSAAVVTNTKPLNAVNDVIVTSRRLTCTAKVTNSYTLQLVNVDNEDTFHKLTVKVRL